MNIIQTLNTLIPTTPKYLCAQSSPVLVMLIDGLAESLAALFPDPTYAAKKLLSLIVVHSQVKGIFANIHHGSQPLLCCIVDLFLEHGCDEHIIDQNSYTQLMDSIIRTATQFNGSPYTDKPNWNEAPIIRWAIDYSGTPVFPRGMYQAHKNLMGIVTSGLGSQAKDFSLTQNVRGLTYPLRRYARLATQTQIKELGNDPSEENLYKLLAALVKANPPLDPLRTGTTFSTYLSDIGRLVLGSTRTQWVTQEGMRSPRINGYSYNEKDTSEYDQLDENNPLRQAFISIADHYETEIEEGLNVDENSDDEQKPSIQTPLQKLKKQPTFFDPWLQTIYRNPTRHSPGVLSTIEIAIALQSTFDLENSELWERSQTTRLVLLGGLFYGWTKQLLTSCITHEPPAPHTHPGITFLVGKPLVSIKPEIPVGYPQSFIPSEENQGRFALIISQHDLHYEHVDHCYLVAIHPVIARDVDEIIKRRSVGESILSQQEYDQAMTDLSSGLQRYSPKSRNITAGRLSASFQGYAASYGMDGSDRYAICGRPTKISEMPVNYTRLALAETCEHHWQWIDTWLKEIGIQRDHLCRSFHWPSWPTNFLPTQGIPLDIHSQLTGYCGSWSVPRVSIVTELLQYIRQQSRRWDVPTYERENWQLRQLAVEACILMCLRDFEFNNLELPTGKCRSESFAHRAKNKHWEKQQTYAVKHIPAIIQSRWWDCIERCTRGYTSGPIWCIRNSAMNRQPFELQTELNRTLTMMGRPSAFIRAKGLRHLGRTMLRQAGLPEPHTNYVMNHYGEGYEKYNPVVGNNFIGFPNIYDQAAEKVARILNILE